MKYEKAEAEIVVFNEREFMAGSGNWDGGTCTGYNNAGHFCGEVSQSGGIFCRNYFYCDTHDCPSDICLANLNDDYFYCSTFA